VSAFEDESVVCDVLDALATQAGCQLPRTGWGYLTFADSSPAAGRAFTDDGTVHEQSGCLWHLPTSDGIAPNRHTRPFPQAGTVFAQLDVGAPDRIRTCAHGSGVHSSLTL